MPRTLLDWLIHEFPTAKRQTLRRMVGERRVRVNGVVATRISQPIKATDKVQASSRKPRGRTPRVTIAPLTIVFEDDDMLVVDKPAGLLTSTVRSEQRPTALAIVRRYVAATDPKARLGLIHRLDRDASGLLVFSKSHLAYDSLKTQFFKHTVERTYEAIVHGSPNPKSGRIETRLVERADGSVFSTDTHAKGQRAITDYETLSTSAGRSVIRVRLLTGRKHQIRVHLSERGCPIVGDDVYGTEDKSIDGLLLSAVTLGFIHPRSGTQMRFNRPR